MTPAVQTAGYVLTHLINEGSFGTVLRGTRLADTLTVAIKVVKKSNLSETEHAALRKQAITLRTLHHRYIVQFYDDFEDDLHFYHVFEYLHGGDLYDRLESRGKPFSEAQVLFLARQLFYAVSYLHSKRAAHRDIKLENFVFETSPTDRRQVMKLIDFDLLVVRSASAPQAELCNDICGTIYYVSPEIAAAREHIPEQSDMWACGVMLFVLLTYHMPFQGVTGRDILKAVRSSHPPFNSAVWAFVSPDTRQLVRDLLTKSGSARPTALEALERVKAIQAMSRDSPQASKLRTLTRGLRSVSLNLWDPSGKVARRARPSEGGHEGVGEGNRRSRSHVPAKDVLSGPSTVRSSFVPHSVTDSEAGSAPTLLGANSVRSERQQLFGHNSAMAVSSMCREERGEGRGGGGEERGGMGGRRDSSEFQTSPTLGGLLARKRMTQQGVGKNDMPQIGVMSQLRSSRRVRKHQKFTSRLRNWMHLGHADHSAR